jgi:hypothetical protein
MALARIAFAAGATLILVALVLTLSGGPPAIAGSNGESIAGELALSNRSAGGCQAGEPIPQGTSAIRLSLGAFTGPRTTVAVYSGPRLVTRGERGSGWTGSAVTVPVTPTSRSYAGARVCFDVDLDGDEYIKIFGQPTKSSIAARGFDGAPLTGRFAIEYLRPASRTWWSLAGVVVRNMGFGNFGGGAWNAVLAVALMVALAALSARLILREIR